MRKIIATTCALLLVSGSAWAQNVADGLDPQPDQSTTRVGTRGANFLEIPVGARGQSLSGAGVALIDGVEALAWNVATIAESRQFSIGWSYSRLFADADIDHQFIGAILPIGATSSLGVSVTALTSGDIVRTTERFPEGGDPQFGSTFSFTGFAASVGWGQQLTDRLDLGGAVKIVQEGIDNATANWLGLDVGALFRTGLIGTTLGVSIQNIGGESSYSGSAIERQVGAAADVFPVEDNVSIAFKTDALALPTSFRFSVLFNVTGTPDAWLAGASLDHNVRLVTDLFDSIDTAVEASIGLEYSYKDIFFARGGKHFFNEDNAGFRDVTDGLSFGGGVLVPGVLDRRLGFEYAYTDMGLLDNIQTISIQLGAT